MKVVVGVQKLGLSVRRPTECARGVPIEDILDECDEHAMFGLY